MTERLKQRLVGALVLVALAVAFAPALFNFEPTQPIDETSKIPVAPDIEPVDIAEAEQPEGAGEPIDHGQMFDVGTASSGEQGDASAEDAVDVDAVSIAPETDEPVAAKAPPEEKPSLNDDGLPAAWVIQVASFSEEATAKQLVAKLNGAGFKAYSRAAQSSGRRVFRVFEGPYVAKARAEEQKSRIDASLKVKVLVLPFEQ